MRKFLPAFFAVLFSAIFCPACGDGNFDTVRREEARYQQEFPGREVQVVALDTLQSARALVPPSRERAYELDRRVGVEGDYYIFTVFTAHGSYTVKGLFALTEYCREARLTEMFLTSPYSVVLQKNMGEFTSAVRAPRGNIFVSSVDSIRGLGRSFHFQSNEWENNYVSANKRDTHSLDGINRKNTPSNLAVRSLAYRLRADVYSENPAWRALLYALAQAPEIISEQPPAVKFFVPCGSVSYLTAQDIVPPWGDKWPLPGGKSSQAEKFIRDDNPAAVINALRTFYADNLQIDANTPVLRRLLNNVAYSPRQQVYIAWYLANINARNSADALNYLALARTAFRAAYNVSQLEMLHAIHGFYAPVERFAALQNQLAAVTRSGQLIVVPLWDHTRTRQNVRHLLLETLNFGTNYNIRNMQVWFTGDCDQSVIDTAAENHITVRANIAELAMFRFTTLRALTYKPQPGDAVVQGTATVRRDPVIYQERAFRPLPVHEVQPKKFSEGTIEIEPDKPMWNGRLAIEKKLPTPPADKMEGNESGARSGKLPPPGRDPLDRPARDPLKSTGPQM